MLHELTWLSLAPELQFGNRRLPLKPGASINFSLSSKRHCVGHKEFGDTMARVCPFEAEIPPGKESQCSYCSKKDISFTAKTGFGLSNQSNELLQSDHAVYIAYFTDSTIKVGVALWERKEVRVLEQGAIACMYIARGNGTVARNFERNVSRLTNLTEWVRIDTKLKALGKQPSEVSVRTALEAAYRNIKNTTPSTVLLESPEFNYLFNSYAMSSCVFSSDIATVCDIGESSKLRGTLVGVYGKVLLIMVDAKVYALNSRLVCGYDIDTIILDDLAGLIEGVVTKNIAIDRRQSLFDVYPGAAE